MEISKDDFVEYEKVRKSGVTNMLDISMVTMLSGLSREQVMFIIKNYAKLVEKYPGVRK